MSGGQVEQDVYLDVHGEQIKAAFDAIDARLKGIQAYVGTITARAEAAGKAMGVGLEQSLKKFNTIESRLTTFENNVKKNDPNLKRANEINAAWAAYDTNRKKSQKDELTHIQQVNQAYDARARQNVSSSRKALDEAKGFTAIERDRFNAAESREKRLEAVAESRIARLNAVQLKGDREADRLREQNNVKTMRDLAQRQVAEAKSIRQLEDIRNASATHIADLRKRSRDGSEQERRAALQMLSIEQDRLKLVEARIKEEVKPASNARIDRSLDVKQGKFDEQAYAATITNLSAAKARQLALETQIGNQIARTRTLEGQQKIDAENILKTDEARLAVIKARVRELQHEHNQLVASAQPKPGTYGPPLPPGMKSPGGPGKPPSTPSEPAGLFGNSGLLGVFGRTAAYGAAAAVIYSTISAIKDGITYSIQFDDAIAKLGAISGATNTQMDQLAETISDVGKNSRFSTLDLAEAATTLAQAGFTQGEIADSLKSISELATASGVTIAEATDVVTAAIGSFQLQASETSHINDVLASALNRTKLNIQQVALGIQYAGATAHENKITFEELTAVMATMANAGIRSGSTIGTGIRQFLVDLQTPTKKLADELKSLGLTMKDIDVDKLGLPEVLNRLASAGFDSAAAYKTLETRAAAAYLVLRNNRQEIQQQIIAQNAIGQSAEAAAKGQDTLAGEWQRFKNVLNDAVHDGLEPATNALRDQLHTINEAAGDETIQKLQKLYDQTSFFDFDRQNQIMAAMDDYLRIKEDLVGAEESHAASLEESTTAYNQATDAVGKQRNTIDSLDDSMARVYVRGKELSTNQIALQAEISTLTNRFQGLASHLDGTALSYTNLTAALREYRLEQLRTLGTALQSQMISARQMGGEHIRTANSVTSTGIKDGLFGQLPKNVQDLYKRVVENPQNDNLRRQLFDAGRSLTGNLRNFIDKFSVELDKGINGLRASDQARGQLDTVGHLSTPKGAALQAEVSAMAGQSDGAIKAKIAALNGAMPGKSKSVQDAYATLITQLESYIGSGASPEAPPEKKKKDRSAERAEHQNDRRESAILSLRMKATEAELKNAIKALLDAGGTTSTDADGKIVITKRNDLTASRLQQNLARVDSTFEKWVTDRTAQVEGEIDKLDMDPDGKQADMMRQELKREIAAKREETQRSVGEQIEKALDLMVETIEQVAKSAEEAAAHQLHLAEARLKSLDRASLEGKVPDFVKGTYERAAARAGDQYDQDLISIQEQKAASLQAAYNQIAMVVDAARQQELLANVDPSLKSLSQLNDQIVALRNNTAELKASFGGEGLIPTKFSDQLAMAIENYSHLNNLTASYGEMIGMNLTDAIGTAHGALTQFLTEATDGTTGVVGAWRNMTMSLIKYLQQLLIKMIAVKLMQLAIGMLGAGAKMDVSVGTASPLASVPGLESLPLLYGGEVTAYHGRYIRDGVSNRDSVRTRIAKGEYVVRKSAVDSVGLDFMNGLNERGAHALRSMGPKLVMPPPAEQHMNVYVVAPENQPSMGPNDVLVTIANDIYRGGPTKQLIKAVVQNG